MINEGRTIYFRLVEESDAAFIHSLRMDEQYNKYLSQVDDDVEKQRQWITRYKQREEQNEEYYFIIHRKDNNLPIGTLRIYDFRPEENSFCWGSWILNENKKGGMWHGRKLRDRTGEILFMDLRQWATNPVKGEQKKKFELSAEQVKRASEIYFKWQSEGTIGSEYAEPELYRSVGFEEIKENNFSLVPSRYIEFVDRDADIDYNAVLTDTANTVADLLKRQRQNDETLRNALNKLGYECK